MNELPKWCEHIKHSGTSKVFHSIAQGYVPYWAMFKDYGIEGNEILDEWKFCPWCGKPRPDPDPLKI